MENTQTMDNSIVLLVGVGGQGTILAGSHETLMGTCPAYAGLYNAQKGGDGRGE